MTANAGSAAALDEILARGGDADDVLRRVVELLAGEPGLDWAGIALVEGDALVLGPNAGTPAEEVRARTPILYEGAVVGELWTDGRMDEIFLSHVATAIASYVLIGWDTQGQTWDP